MVETQTPQTLLVMRHGIAEPSTERRDVDRRLTQAGVAEVVAAAPALLRLGLKVGRVLTSPLLRARETSTLLAQTLGWKDPEVVDALACGATPETMVQVARQGSAITALV